MKTENLPLIDDFECLNFLAKEVYDLAVEKGWHDQPGETKDQFVMRTVANIHGECSELWESCRNGTLTQPCDKSEKMVHAGVGFLTCEEEELADIVIRALDAAQHLNINIGSAVARKHAFNKTRPHRHGGKLY